MKEPSSSREFWSEFDWERELRKDDERVHTYLQELPKFIDLPQEDALIYRKIQRREELIPHGGVWNFEQNSEEDDPEAREEENAFRSTWFLREGADVYIGCGKLARSVSSLFVIEPGIAGSEAAMCLLVTVGKTMAEMMDVLRLEPDELPNLRIALYKRISADFNTILGYQNELLKAASGSEAQALLLSMNTLVNSLREQIVDALIRTRHPERKNPENDGIPPDCPF